jgi:hypothetical protein
MCCLQDAQSLAQLDLRPGEVSLPEIPAIHQHARGGQELQLLLALALFGADINELIPASGCSVLDAGGRFQMAIVGFAVGRCLLRMIVVAWCCVCVCAPRVQHHRQCTHCN